MAFCVCLLSLSIKFWRFIHVVACTSFLFVAELYSVVCIHHILFIHLSVDGHLVLFAF